VLPRILPFPTVDGFSHLGLRLCVLPEPPQLTRKLLRRSRQEGLVPVAGGGAGPLVKVVVIV